ncbi:DUF4435 domain-containing protein [Acinetobacter johnsonii]|uniref:DUF4435 domain-containing protein n=1 Tax=Acinetobacter johnsonii TaxID=40214 RepID=UPI001F2CFDB2|nr:DUF4435 domain-containing protein [Acinetobacter johnsonii]UIZ98217.1 DUF4435 domain-containing protein [Acinetobacter johnsonii]
MFPKVEVDDLLNIAQMSGTPYLIVEGVDDIPIYEKFKNLHNLNFEIFSAEEAEGIEPGCRGVEKIISILNDANDEAILEKNVIGIADKDVKDFRNELKVFKNIIYTDYYSLETHLISDDVILKVISNFIRNPENMIDRGLINQFWEYFQSEANNLYYISLDALKKSLDLEYESHYTYSSGYNETKNSFLNSKVLGNSVLSNFESEINLSYSRLTLKKICKGKWFIEFFCEKLTYFIKNILKSCVVSNRDDYCRTCILEMHNSCLYKLKDNIVVSKDSVKAVVISFCEHGDFKFILDKVIVN